MRIQVFLYEALRRVSHECMDCYVLELNTKLCINIRHFSIAFFRSILFSDDNTRFEVNSPILWLITRKTLGQNLSKDPIPMFYVVSDEIRTEHRG